MHRELVDAGIEPKTPLSDLKLYRYGVETPTDVAQELRVRVSPP